MSESLVGALYDTLLSLSADNEYSDGRSANITDGVFAIATALNRVANALERLGLANGGEHIPLATRRT